MKYQETKKREESVNTSGSEKSTSKTESLEKVSVPNERKQQSFYEKMSDIRNVFLAKKPMYLMFYKDFNLNINDSLPSVTIALL